MERRLNCIAVDESNTSDHAFQWYCQNFHRNDDKVIILHIRIHPQMPTIFSGILSGNYSLTEESRLLFEQSINKSRMIVLKYKDLCEKQKIDFEIVMEDNYFSPGYMICDVTKKRDVSTIILGQRGAGTFTRIFLGSTSDYVIHHSKIPVLIIPPPTDPVITEKSNYIGSF